MPEVCMPTSTPSPVFNPGKANWSAVFSLFMGVTGLIAAEFIPISLLTPIAQELRISEGMAGQTVTAVGIFAVITSLLLAPLSRNINRRYILLTFSALLIVSNLLVAMAPSYPLLLLGRGMLGICVGGFWSMASAVALQLVPPKDVPRALSIIYAGVSVATVISLPLASYLGHVLGWRNVFYLASLMGLAAFLWQFVSLPHLPAQGSSSFRGMFNLLKKNWVLTGMVATVFSYGGYHVFFTYLRPFLELELALSSSSLSAVLLVFGLANCLGTFIAGGLLGRYFKTGMAGIHILFAGVALCLFFSSGFVSASVTLVIVWGFVFGFIPVGWSTWITRTLADSAEIAGGISVAAIQFSIGLAAAVGGLTFDNLGINGIFFTAACFFILAVGLVRASFSAFAHTTGKNL